MLNYEQFQECIVKPALSKLQLYSVDAVELIAFTCAAESDGGTYLQQIKGPALGIYQHEPATYNDIWQSFITYRPYLLNILSLNFDAYRMPPETRLVYDLQYATAMARIHYLRVSEPLPKSNDVNAIYDYYKAHWNSHLGKATKTKSIAAYNRFKGS